MKSWQRMRGAMTQSLVNFLLIIFISLMAIKLVPVYFDEYAINAALESVTDEVNQGYLQLSELKDAFRKRLLVNNISLALVDELEFVRFEGKRYVVLDYEEKRRFLANIHLSFDFELKHEITINE